MGEIKKLSSYQENQPELNLMIQLNKSISCHFVDITLLLLLEWMREFCRVVVSSNLFSVSCRELLTVNCCFGPFILPLFHEFIPIVPLEYVHFGNSSYYVPIMSSRVYIIDLMEMNLIHCNSSLYQVQEARSLICFYKCCKYLTSPTALQF